MEKVQAVLVEIDFDEAKKIWQQKLWPNRQSPIEPVACINRNGAIDLSIKNSSPRFYKLMHLKNSRLSDTWIAAGSVIQISDTESRLRGIIVRPKFQGMGLGRYFINLLEQTLNQDCQFLWAMPRQSNQVFFQKLGFTTFLNLDGYEFGPHYLMGKEIFRNKYSSDENLNFDRILAP